MGYTHYFSHQTDIPSDAWERIKGDFETLLADQPMTTATAGGHHADDPLRLEEITVDEQKIAFNGGPEDQDLGHEPFVLYQEQAKADDDGLARFCKTARKPYDLVVCAVLLRVYHHAPDALSIGSDGDREEWAPAMAWVQDLFGQTDFPDFLQGPINADAGMNQLAANAAPWFI